MTTIVPKTVTCAVCGRKSEVSIICSTNAFGSPDLDLRPPEMQRSTMGLWVQECPYCHYAASDLQEPYEGAADRLTAADYLDCSKLEQLPESARKFYRYHLLRLEQADWEGAFSGALWTAWCCDDAGDDKNAARLRCEALSALEYTLKAMST